MTVVNVDRAQAGAPSINASFSANLRVLALLTAATVAATSEVEAPDGKSTLPRFGDSNAVAREFPGDRKAAAVE